MSEKAIKKKKVRTSTVFFTTAIGLAVIVGFMGSSSISSAKKQAQIVEAASNISAYSKITASDVKVVTVSQMDVPADAYKNMNDVVGKFTGMALDAGTPMRSSEIASGIDRPAGFLAQNTQTKKLVMVSVPTQQTDLALGIQPGDHINLVGLIKNSQTITEKRINDVEVLKIDDSNKNTQNGPNLWVMVPPDQTDAIHQAVANGLIRLELLPEGGSTP